MDFKNVSKMSVGEVVTVGATEGGAVVAGLLGAGFVGKQLENVVKTGVVPTSPTMDKMMAYVANNGPKLVAWYFMRKESTGALKQYEMYAKDTAKGILGSVVLDTIVRAGNNFAPKPLYQLFGYDVLGDKTQNVGSTPQSQANMQKVLQENSSLRAQLNSALQRVASASPNVTVTPVRSAAQIPPPPPSNDSVYGTMPVRGNSKYGTMPVNETKSQRDFGQMNDISIDGATKTLGSMFNFD